MYSWQHSAMIGQLASSWGSQQWIGSMQRPSSPHRRRPEHQSRKILKFQILREINFDEFRKIKHIPSFPHCSGVSSDPSVQSLTPSQTKRLAIQWCLRLWHWKNPILHSETKEKIVKNEEKFVEIKMYDNSTFKKPFLQRGKNEKISF